MSAPRDDAGLTEARDKWLLPVGDGKVTQLRFDYAFTLVLESWGTIRIETPFSHQATVTSAEIRKDGRLTLAFADDRAGRAAGRAL